MFEPKIRVLARSSDFSQFPVEQFFNKYIITLLSFVISIFPLTKRINMVVFLTLVFYILNKIFSIIRYEGGALS